VRVNQSEASVNDPLAAQVHQNEVSDAMNPNTGHQIEDNNWRVVGPSNFNLEQYTANDEYMFIAQSTITYHIEKHFR